MEMCIFFMSGADFVSDFKTLVLRAQKELRVDIFGAEKSRLIFFRF